jgi:serine/threonine-protein kinase
MEPRPDLSSAETVAVVPVSASSSTSSTADEGRFLPGTLLGGRYRIIALLGRGGMGEVYRATDLTLGQSVALKFLPEEASRNQRLLERFHGEVRIARQVSHPNVCRVYDIGEVEGMPFISMEYVDGEDLASLLTRIGRLPGDKALETARKLCAGLAAAHDRGVIHRDLKPQNIMINKRGEVVIMDFGLAAIAGQLSGAEASVGTPAYMAPEQLKGAEVTARSDVYALGLVLYELFTGKRAFEAKSLRHLLDLEESVHLTSMSSAAADIDPAVEKAIRRCLDPDPVKRPAGPLAVAAALPGGDPLAAALAAGETPSPEMVAAAGETEGMALRYSVPCLALIVASFVGAMVLGAHRNAMIHTPLDLPPAALAAKARETIASLGYPRRPADFSLRLDSRGSYVNYLQRLPEPRKWDDWLASEAPIAADYRESAVPLVAEPTGDVSRNNPPQVAQGMAYLRLDGLGRLLEFSAVPYELPDQLKEPIEPRTVFHAAGLDIAGFTEVQPRELPTAPADELRAWKGPHPKIPNTELTIEIASWRGRITRARVAPPWAGPNPKPPAGPTANLGDIYGMAITFLVLLFALLFARRNWKLGRVDRNGALRVAAARFVLALISWVGSVHAVASAEMFNLISRAAADWLLSAALLWVVYLALEPAVRARWPHSLVTWNRVMAGRWLDPLVASHVLIGGVVGCMIWQAFALSGIWFGARNIMDSPGSLFYVEGARHWISGNAGCLGGALRIGLTFFFALFVLRTLLRRDWLAAAVASLFGLFMEGSVVNSPDWPIKAVVYSIVYFTIFIVLLRFGLVATISAVFFINSFNGMPLGMDWTTWYAPYALATLALLLAITAVAFWRSLGSRGLLGDVAEAG